MIKTIFFDIYQTLIDVDIEQKNIHRAWKIFDSFISKEYKVPNKNEFEQLVKIQENTFYEKKSRSINHRDFKESIREVFNSFYNIDVEEKKLDELIWEFRNKSRDYYNLYEDVKETLEMLAKEYVLATASIAHGSFTLRELKELGIDKYFSYFIFSSNSGFKKPSKEFYQYALEQVKSKPRECIMIGDNLVQDIWGAQQLKLWTILIKNPITSVFDSQIKPDEIVPVENFSMIKGAIKNIEQKTIRKESKNDV